MAIPLPSTHGRALNLHRNRCIPVLVTNEEKNPPKKKCPSRPLNNKKGRGRAAHYAHLPSLIPRAGAKQRCCALVVYPRQMERNAPEHKKRRSEYTLVLQRVAAGASFGGKKAAGERGAAFVSRKARATMVELAAAPAPREEGRGSGKLEGEREGRIKKSQWRWSWAFVRRRRDYRATRGPLDEAASSRRAWESVDAMGLFF